LRALQAGPGGMGGDLAGAPAGILM